MLDNVIDINLIPRQRNVRNARHRPIGLWGNGVQDALQTLRISYASQQAVEFADQHGSDFLLCHFGFDRATKEPRHL
ncbi:MAG: hypothetical protein U0894_05225 [Pirellulales bacterium]